MKITKLILKDFASNGIIPAFATVTFDNGLTISNIKICNYQGRLFIQLPGAGQSRPCRSCIIDPVRSPFYSSLEDAIISYYLSTHENA